jgi:hypothetical protein
VCGTQFGNGQEGRFAALVLLCPREQPFTARVGNQGAGSRLASRLAAQCHSEYGDELFREGRPSWFIFERPHTVASTPGWLVAYPRALAKQASRPYAFAYVGPLDFSVVPQLENLFPCLEGWATLHFSDNSTFVENGAG